MTPLRTRLHCAGLISDVQHKQKAEQRLVTVTVSVSVLPSRDKYFSLSQLSQSKNSFPLNSLCSAETGQEGRLCGVAVLSVLLLARPTSDWWRLGLTASHSHTLPGSKVLPGWPPLPPLPVYTLLQSYHSHCTVHTLLCHYNIIIHT